MIGVAFWRRHAGMAGGVARLAGAAAATVFSAYCAPPVGVLHSVPTPLLLAPAAAGLPHAAAPEHVRQPLAAEAVQMGASADLLQHTYCLAAWRGACVIGYQTCARS